MMIQPARSRRGIREGLGRTMEDLGAFERGARMEREMPVQKEWGPDDQEILNVLEKELEEKRKAYVAANQEIKKARGVFGEFFGKKVGLGEKEEEAKKARQQYDEALKEFAVKRIEGMAGGKESVDAKGIFVSERAERIREELDADVRENPKMARFRKELEDYRSKIPRWRKLAYGVALTGAGAVAVAYGGVAATGMAASAMVMKRAFASAGLGMGVKSALDGLVQGGVRKFSPEKKREVGEQFVSYLEREIKDLNGRLEREGKFRKFNSFLGTAAAGASFFVPESLREGFAAAAEYAADTELGQSFLEGAKKMLASAAEKIPVAMDKVSELGAKGVELVSGIGAGAQEGVSEVEGVEVEPEMGVLEVEPEETEPVSEEPVTADVAPEVPEAEMEAEKEVVAPEGLAEAEVEKPEEDIELPKPILPEGMEPDEEVATEKIETDEISEDLEEKMAKQLEIELADQEKGILEAAEKEFGTPDLKSEVETVVSESEPEAEVAGIEPEETEPVSEEPVTADVAPEVPEAETEAEKGTEGVLEEESEKEVAELEESEAAEAEKEEAEKEVSEPSEPEKPEEMVLAQAEKFVGPTRPYDIFKGGSIENSLVDHLSNVRGVDREEAWKMAHRIALDYAKERGIPFERLNTIPSGTVMEVGDLPDKDGKVRVRIAKISSIDDALESAVAEINLKTAELAKIMAGNDMASWNSLKEMRIGDLEEGDKYSELYKEIAKVTGREARDDENLGTWFVRAMEQASKSDKIAQIEQIIRGTNG